LNFQRSTCKYLFGPVPSRRFGLSLGVDLVPRKTCTLDCVFCEVGPTTRLTVERKEYAPVAEVERELKTWLAEGGAADVISVTGSGEPTLHSGFGEILRFIKSEIKIKTILLTNSTLLHLPEVRRSAAGADIVKATFSAWDENSFRALARPHPDLRFASLLEGLKSLRAEYEGRIWLEVFVAPGINDALAQIGKIAELAGTLQADKIQLNTAVRPTAECGVSPVDEKKMREIAGLFRPKAEVIAKYSGNVSSQKADRNAVLAMLRRRPCTVGDVSASFGLDIAYTKNMLHEMLADGLARVEQRGDDEYFTGICPR